MEGFDASMLDKFPYLRTTTLARHLDIEFVLTWLHRQLQAAGVVGSIFLRYEFVVRLGELSFRFEFHNLVVIHLGARSTHCHFELARAQLRVRGGGARNMECRKANATNVVQS
ncbi:MAG: hypothetical protein JWP89_3443 [Schlesneria sp.]|nr:hypothetical protein [Schlesneria sp.]